MSSDACIVHVFWVAEAFFTLTVVVLCVAEFVIRRPISISIPSVYWPVSKLGLNSGRKSRRIFHLLIGKLYRKHFWNPAVNSILKQRGFERQRHLSSSNIHAASSAMVLTMVAFFIYNQQYLGALLLTGFELIFNAHAIILSRYLYLLTVYRNLRGPKPTSP